MYKLTLSFSLPQQNETFLLCNCTMARCIENNTIEIVPYECPPIKEITCSNGKKPVLVYDEDHCCQQYVCECKLFCVSVEFVLTHFLKIRTSRFVSFQVSVKAGGILITSHLMDYTTAIKETALMS